jgi:hypothetical protein
LMTSIRRARCGMSVRGTGATRATTTGRRYKDKKQKTKLKPSGVFFMPPPSKWQPTRST